MLRQILYIPLYLAFLFLPLHLTANGGRPVNVPEVPQISGGAAIHDLIAKHPQRFLHRPDGPLPQAVQSPLAPGLYTSFDCITFDGNASNTGYYQIPPDPMGAAGPNHVVLVVNSSIEWYAKDGTLQNSQSLKSFFSNLEPQTNTFDPIHILSTF